MIVKPANPAAVIRDPITKRQIPAEGGEVPGSSFWIRRTLASSTEDAEMWVRDGEHWTRRMRDGSVTRELAVDPPAVDAPVGAAVAAAERPIEQPVDNAIPPLTTRARSRS